MIALAIVLIWLFDYFSGPELSVSIFYLLPVGLASWTASRRTGVLAAVVCAVGWLFNDAVTNPAQLWFVPFWNAGVRLAIFLLVAHTVSSLKQSRERQEELSSFVVHDLRSPLANAMACLEMIRELAAARSYEEMQQFVDLGVDSVEDALTLIDSILDLARLENDEMPVHTQRVAVNELLREAIQQVSAIGLREEVQIELRGAGEDIAVWADPALLGRVLVNLLNNALRFSPRRSMITVEAVRGDKGRLQIVITDRGPGIPEKYRGKAFEKYKQLQARKEGQAMGSGLGLAFCRMAVEAQRGKIWLEDAQPLGTSVHVTLPLAAQE